MELTALKMLPVTACLAIVFVINFTPACGRNVSFVTKRQAALGDGGDVPSARVVSDGQWSRQCSYRVDDALKAAAKEIARRRGEAQLSLPPNKGGGGHWEEWKGKLAEGRAKREARRGGRKGRGRRGRRKKDGNSREAGWSVLHDVQERIRAEMLREEGEKKLKQRRIQNIFVETRGKGGGRGKGGAVHHGKGGRRRGGRKGRDWEASNSSGNGSSWQFGARKRRVPRGVHEWPPGLSLLRPLRSAPGMDMTVQGLSFQSFDAATTMGCNFARGEGEAPPALKVAVVYKKAIVTGRVGINGRLHGASDNRAATGEEGKERGNKRYMECEMSARVSDLTVIVTIHAERRRRLDGGGGGGMGEWGPEPRGGESKAEDSAEEGWKEETEKAGEEAPKWRKKAEEKGGEEREDPEEEVPEGGEWREGEDKGAEEGQSEEEEWDAQEHSVEEGWKEEKPERGQEWRREEVPPVSKMAPDPAGAFEAVAKTGKLEEREGEKKSAHQQRDEVQIRAPSNQIEPPEEEGDEGRRESTRVPRVAWGTNPREQGGKRVGEAWRGEEEEGLGWTEGGGREGSRDEARGGRRVEKWEEGRGAGSGERDTLGVDAEKWGGKGEGGGKARSGWVGSVKELGWGEEAEVTAASGVSGNRKAKEDDWEPVVGSKAPRSRQAERAEPSATEGGKLQGARSEALREWGGPRGEEDGRGRSWGGSKSGGSSQGRHREVRGGPSPHGSPHSGYREKWPVLIRGRGVPVEASGRGGGPTGVGAERRTWDEKPKAERRRERWPVFESRPPDKWAVNWVTGERNRGSTPGRDSQGPHPGQHEHHGPLGARGDTARGPFLESRVRSQHPGSKMGARQNPHPSRYPARSEGASDHSGEAGFFGGHPPSGKRYRRSTVKYTKPEKKAEFKVLEELKKDPWWSGNHAYQKDANTRDSERRAFIDLLTKMTEQQSNSEALVGIDDIQIFELHPQRENITRGDQRESQNSELSMQAKYNVKPLLAKEDENLFNGTNIAWSNIQENFGHKIKLGFSQFGGGNLSAFNAQVEEGRKERRKRSGDQLGGLESLKHARSPILMKSESFMVGLPLIRFSGCTEDFGWLKQSWESESQFHGNSQVRGPDPLRLKQEMEGLFYGGVKRMIGMFSERTVRGILAEDLATKLGFIVSYG